jgi:hypothetical protein
MVQDSIVNVFSSALVSVAGIDVAGGVASDSVLKHFVDSAHITFPIAKPDTNVSKAFSVAWDGLVVIDKNGVVRFVQSRTGPPYDTMVCNAVSKVRGLLATNIARPLAFALPAGRNTGGLLRYFTLSGQLVALPATSLRTGIVLRRLDGRVTRVVGFAKPQK